MSHCADDVALSSPMVAKRRGIADGWLRGKARLRENFAVGVQAPGLRFELVDAVRFDADDKAKRVIACYGQPR